MYRQKQKLYLLLLIALCTFFAITSAAQNKRAGRQASHGREPMSVVERQLVDQAMTVICLERVKDPKGSWPIDDMQGRPSLPVTSPEAVEGAARAQRLLTVTKKIVVAELRELAKQYAFNNSAKLERAIQRIAAVRRIKPDMESRDNASVYLRNPHSITFGTIFLAGLPSDEGMVSVLAHELTHLADGDGDDLLPLFRNVGNRAGTLISYSISGQRAEELTCDLVGALAARTFVKQSPNYEPLPRRIARSIEHNCVDQDTGDEDHLSPRQTIRAVMALDSVLTRELVYGREERR